MDNNFSSYINMNSIATVSTINPDGSPHGAVVFICVDTIRPIVYFITKQQTQKYKNIQSRNDVSVTIVNPAENSTLQADGRAFEVTDAITIDTIMKKIAHEHVSAIRWLPPIAKVRAGAYVVMGVELSHARLARFNNMAIGDEHIFTNLNLHQKV